MTEEVILQQEIRYLKATLEDAEKERDLFKQLWGQVTGINYFKDGEVYTVWYNRQAHQAKVMAGEFVLIHTDYPPVKFDDVIVLEREK